MFDLKSISRTRRMAAPKMLLAGEPKLGKSTFAAGAPNCVFINVENGLDGIDAHAFPQPKTLADVYGAINTLLTQDHDFGAVAIDSLDWLEPLLQAHVCAANKWENIESPGFGKGHLAAAAEWRTLLDGLERLRLEKNMAVILICHVKQQRIESPTHEGFDAWVLKLNPRATAIMQEYADILGFCAHRIALKKTDAGFGQKETKAIRTGERVLHLEAHPAYPSGNRFGLTDCPLSWEAFAAQLSMATNPQPQAA